MGVQDQDEKMLDKCHYFIKYPRLVQILRFKNMNSLYGFLAHNWRSTGCPLLLWTLCFLPFLGFQSTQDKNVGHFHEAHKILISKMSLILKIDQYLTKIWPPQCWVPYFKINISKEVFVTVTGLSIVTAKEFALISQDKKQPIS